MMIDSTGSLSISSLKTTDRGSYVCEVNNEIGQAKKQFQIDVYGKVLFNIEVLKLSHSLISNFYIQFS